MVCDVLAVSVQIIYTVHEILNTMHMYQLWFQMWEEMKGWVPDMSDPTRFGIQPFLPHHQDDFLGAGMLGDLWCPSSSQYSTVI